VNGTGRQGYELSKQLQDVSLISERRLKTCESFFIPNYNFHRTDHYPGRKGGTVFAVAKDILQNHVELQGSAYLLVIVKYCLQLFINLQVVMLTSLSS
jgi:hypothetical protein